MTGTSSLLQGAMHGTNRSKRNFLWKIHPLAAAKLLAVSKMHSKYSLSEPKLEDGCGSFPTQRLSCQHNTSGKCPSEGHGYWQPWRCSWMYGIVIHISVRMANRPSLSPHRNRNDHPWFLSRCHTSSVNQCKSHPSGPGKDRNPKQHRLLHCSSSLAKLKAKIGLSK